VGIGKVDFYKYIGAKYMNITRDETGAFLDSKINYQMNRPTNKHINKPLLSGFPNQKWGIYLIDTSSYHKHNHGVRYVVTVVDFFSRKTWLGMTVKKSADAIKDMFAEILKCAKVSPNFLVADNGTEFKASFDAFCKAEGIKIIRTATYSPQSNSIVERKNQEVRKRIRAFMTKNQNLHWTPHLGDIERALNATHNSTTGTSADRLWSREKQAINDPEKLKSQIRQQDRAVRLIDKFNAVQFKTGDYVRMLMSSIFSNIRKKVKQNDTKYQAIKWTPKIFRVKAEQRTGKYERPRYSIVNEDGRAVQTRKNGKKSFYSDELLLATNRDEPQMTMAKALKLNGVTTNAHDLLY
jgi:hypothetical protein